MGSPATDQMAEVVVQLVRNSFGAQSYDKALECVEAYRKVAIVVRPASEFVEAALGRLLLP